jgi:hypothetical protein
MCGSCGKFTTQIETVQLNCRSIASNCPSKYKIPLLSRRAWHGHTGPIIMLSMPNSYLLWRSGRSHLGYLLVCLTLMHEHSQLPGGPHFSQQQLRCLWPGLGQGRLAPHFYVLYFHVSGTPDHISNDEVPVPRLHVTSPLQPSAHASAPSTADSEDEVPIPRFSHPTAPVSCYGDAEVPLPGCGVSCLSSSSSPPFVRPQAALKAGGRGRCPLGYV